MNIFTNCIFVVIALYYIQCEVVSTSTIARENSTNSNKTLEWSFSSGKNQTGHYVTQWKLGKKLSFSPTNMKFDVKSSTSEIGGVHLFQIRAVLTVPPPKPADYELFPGIGYYKFYHEGAANYFDASKICLNDGGHLAILNSEAESYVLKTMYSRYPTAKTYAWVGFNDINEEGKFVTIFGTPLEQTGFLKWRTDNPDDFDNEDCGAIDTLGQIMDLSCDRHPPRPFFCEYDLHWGEI